MKKIRTQHSSSDRIVCASLPGKHKFYYQPARGSERVWLFDTKDYSIDIFSYFRDKGRKLGNKSFSLTIRELYEFKKYHNRELAAVMQRLPGQLEYVLRDRADAA